MNPDIAKNNLYGPGKLGIPVIISQIKPPKIVERNIVFLADNNFNTPSNVKKIPN